MQITDNRKNIFSIDLLEEEQDSEVLQVVFSHLQTVIAERDGYVQVRMSVDSLQAYSIESHKASHVSMLYPGI